MLRDEALTGAAAALRLIGAPSARRRRVSRLPVGGGYRKLGAGFTRFGAGEAAAGLITLSVHPVDIESPSGRRGTRTGRRCVRRRLLARPGGGQRHAQYTIDVRADAVW